MDAKCTICGEPCMIAGHTHLLNENSEQGRIVYGYEAKPNLVYFSQPMDPETVPEMKRITIKPRWLMTAVLWTLRKLGFKVYDMRLK